MTFALWVTEEAGIGQGDHEARQTAGGSPESMSGPDGHNHRASFAGHGHLVRCLYGDWPVVTVGTEKQGYKDQEIVR